MTNDMTNKTSHYTEPSRKVPIMGQWDVVVAGGGPAGCAAALAAARTGARTLIFEKDGYLGGQTVAALVCAVLSVNGVDFQGVWHDYIRAIARRRGVGDWKRSSVQMINTLYPEVVKYAWDDLLEEAGVQILHHCHFAGSIIEEGQIRGVLLNTRAGRRAVMASRVVDGTGHGIVCHDSGVPWEQGDGTHPWAMSLTKVFRLAGMEWDGITYTDEILAKAEAALDEGISNGLFTSPVVTEKRRLLGYVRGRMWDMGSGRRQIMSVLSRVLKVDPLDPWDFTRAEREGRAQAWEAAEAHRLCVPGFENSYLLDTAPQIGVRSTRRVHGLERVTDDDAWFMRKKPNSIARSSWNIDVWPADSYSAEAVKHSDTEHSERIHRVFETGDYFDIPYGCILPKGVDNLLMAGQCVSASHLAESSLRIQQTCMATGQAAGTAAAMSITEGVTPRELDPAKLIAKLDADRAATEPAFDFLADLPVAPGWSGST